MKSVIQTWKLLVVCILFATACEMHNKPPNKNSQKNSLNSLSSYIGNKSILDFKGIVLDENENPIKDVIVSVSNKTKLTDFNGSFEIKKASVNSHFAQIIFRKNGFKEYVMTITPNDYNTEISIVLKKENTLCLFWFCIHNHNLP